MATASLTRPLGDVPGPGSAAMRSPTNVAMSTCSNRSCPSDREWGVTTECRRGAPLRPCCGVVGVRAPCQPSDRRERRMFSRCGKNGRSATPAGGPFCPAAGAGARPRDRQSSSGPPRCPELWSLMVSYGLNVAWEGRGKTQPPRERTTARPRRAASGS
jgi:hypothetical protein